MRNTTRVITFIAVIAAVLVMTAICPTVSAQDRNVTLYVFTKTNHTGFVDAASQRLQDSVKDVREALAKKKGITLVDDATAATVALEIVGSATETATGRPIKEQKGGLFGQTLGDDQTVHGKLTVGAYATDLIGDAKGRTSFGGFGGWKNAAKDLADRVADWVKVNRVRLGSEPR